MAKLTTKMTTTDQRIVDVMKQSGFTFSAEVIPPRNGAEQEKILQQIEALTAAGAQFLSVTKGAGGSLRGGSLPIAYSIKEQFNVPCIAHFTCRDLSPAEVENQLMDHHYFGIRNILALRGDPPQDQPDWTPAKGSYPYAYQLIEQIKKLNDGRYLSRPDNQRGGEIEKTQFCIGAAVYPEFPDERNRLEYFRLKVQAGAEYGITQMLFDTDAYARFLDLCGKNQITVPILPGTRILTSQAQALRMSKRFEVGIGRDLLNSLPEQEGASNHNQIIDIFSRFTEKLESL